MLLSDTSKECSYPSLLVGSMMMARAVEAEALSNDFVILRLQLHWLKHKISSL